mmetsp:Transcript_95780/g.292901  ORF Transcript_95780/g.292901 Transcript_95780/m.292901 type:complete len:251 (-) Transcript_95780:72-824(-)
MSIRKASSTMNSALKVCSKMKKVCSLSCHTSSSATMPMLLPICRPYASNCTNIKIAFTKMSKFMALSNGPRMNFSAGVRSTSAISKLPMRLRRRDEMLLSPSSEEGLGPRSRPVSKSSNSWMTSASRFSRSGRSERLSASLPDCLGRLAMPRAAAKSPGSPPAGPGAVDDGCDAASAGGAFRAGSWRAARCAEVALTSGLSPSRAPVSNRARNFSSSLTWATASMSRILLKSTEQAGGEGAAMISVSAMS